MRSAYAWMCTRCPHLAADHRLVLGSDDTAAGPYRCRQCECERPQDGPDTPLSKRQFDALPAHIRNGPMK